MVGLPCPLLTVEAPCSLLLESSAEIESSPFASSSFMSSSCWVWLCGLCCTSTSAVCSRCHGALVVLARQLTLIPELMSSQLPSNRFPKVPPRSSGSFEPFECFCFQKNKKGPSVVVVGWLDAAATRAAAKFGVAIWLAAALTDRRTDPIEATQKVPGGHD